jgi:hypothetical protein
MVVVKMSNIDDWDDDEDKGDRDRECSDSCPHYDSLNRCCWQAGEWGLYFHVFEGNYCQLGYKENDGR